MKTRLIDEDVAVHSVSAELDYPGVGPEHAMFRASGRSEYRGVTDEEALKAFRTLSEIEGSFPPWRGVTRSRSQRISPLSTTRSFST